MMDVSGSGDHRARRPFFLEIKWRHFHPTTHISLLDRPPFFSDLFTGDRFIWSWSYCSYFVVAINHRRVASAAIAPRCAIDLLVLSRQ